MADPFNPADIPEPWIREYHAQPKPEGYTRAVGRKVKNNRHQLVVDMAEVLVKVHQQRASSPTVTRLVSMLTSDLADKSDAWWRDLAIIAGHPSSRPGQETRAAVIAKVRDELAGS
jgi:hypothetical protein